MIYSRVPTHYKGLDFSLQAQPSPFPLDISDLPLLFLVVPYRWQGYDISDLTVQPFLLGIPNPTPSYNNIVHKVTIQ